MFRTIALMLCKCFLARPDPIFQTGHPSTISRPDPISQTVHPSIVASAEFLTELQWKLVKSSRGVDVLFRMVVLWSLEGRLVSQWDRVLA
jgi:hypothetical protein